MGQQWVSTASVSGSAIDIHTTDATWHIYHGGELLAEVPRTTGLPVARFKARKPEPPRHKRVDHPAQT